MCDGGTFSVPITLALLSTATSMYAQNEQRKQQQAAATAQIEGQMRQEEYDKSVRQEAAQLENARGIAERDRAMRAAQMRLAEQVSMLAAGGFELDSGSNLSLLADSAEEAQHDADLMTHEINVGNWRNLTGITGSDNRLSLLATEKENAAGGPDRIGLGSTLMGGLLSGAQTAWGTYQKNKKSST